MEGEIFNRKNRAKWVQNDQSQHKPAYLIFIHSLIEGYAKVKSISIKDRKRCEVGGSKKYKSFK